MDGADGSDDWWVELYNTSNQVYDAAGVTIVVNNKIVGGHAADGPLGVSFRWRDIPPMIAYGADVTAEKPYHFQIAADAVFEEIVFDSRYDGGAQSIAQGRLKPGSYWARVRYDSPRLSTDWSETRSFTYR